MLLASLNLREEADDKEEMEFIRLDMAVNMHYSDSPAYKNRMERRKWRRAYDLKWVDAVGKAGTAAATAIAAPNKNVVADAARLAIKAIGLLTVHQKGLDQRMAAEDKEEMEFIRLDLAVNRNGRNSKLSAIVEES